MLKYKLLALDIDNTLTDQPSVVPQRNLEAVKRAQDAGVFVTVATGRGHLGASSIIRALDIDGPVICYGGAIIVDAKTAAPLFVSEIDSALVHEALSLAEEKSIHAQIYQGDGIVCAQNDIYTQTYTGRLKLPALIDPEINEKSWKNVPKVLWITDPAQVPALIAELKARFAGRLKISGSSPGFIEFNVLGVDKGSGLARLSQMLDIPREAVAAAGDNTLDAEMLSWAGLGAAVADAKPEIRALADVITPACAECGVAWLIDEMILREG